MKKIFLFITFGLFAISAFSQQQQNRHEFSVWAGGGINSLQSTDLAVGKHSLGLGLLGGIGYNYFFNYHWSIGTGAEFSMLNGYLDYDRLEGSYYAYDGSVNGLGTFQLNYSTTKTYEESQRAFYINIPLMVKYQFDVWKQHKFYAAAGGKIGIPLSGKYKGNGAFTTSFQQIDDNGNPVGHALTPDNSPSFQNRGIGNYDASYDNDVDFKVNYMLSAEAGMKWKLSDALALYTGVYFDYGLNDLRKSTNTPSNELFAYNPVSPANYSSNPAMNAVYNGQEMVGKVSSLGLGLKAQLTFGIKPFTKKPSKAERKAAELAAAQAATTAAEDKPFEGLTAAQMQAIMDKSNKDMMDFQRKEFDALKDLLKKEAPELTQAIINFDLDKKAILPRMHAELDKKVALMNQHPKANILLEGHTDDSGSMEYNYQLGLDRANAARDYMISKGISPNRLSVASKGKTQPAYPNSTEDNRFRNRRVEFILQP